MRDRIGLPRPADFPLFVCWNGVNAKPIVGPLIAAFLTLCSRKRRATFEKKVSLEPEQCYTEAIFAKLIVIPGEVTVVFFGRRFSGALQQVTCQGNLDTLPSGRFARAISRSRMFMQSWIFNVKPVKNWNLKIFTFFKVIRFQCIWMFDSNSIE